MAHGKIYDNIADLIGNTPLVRINRIQENGAAELDVKLELFNPLSSVKDRIAISMINDARRRGRSSPASPRSWKRRAATPASAWRSSQQRRVTAAC